jgi:GAF domain-containing protein
MGTASRLIVERQQRLRDRVGSSSSLGRDAIALLNLAIERALLIDGGSMANAQMVDTRRGGLWIAAHTGFPTAFLEFFEFVEHDSNASCGTALANASAVWVAHTDRSPIFAGSQALEVMLDAGSRAVASVPVTSPNGDVLAMINTHHRRPANWTHRQKARLERLARTTGRILNGLQPPSSGATTADWSCRAR